MFFCTWLICRIWWLAKQAKILTFLYNFVYTYCMYRRSILYKKAFALAYTLLQSFCTTRTKKASADADAHNQSYDKAKSSFSVSFAFCKMYETLGSHPFSWRRFKILLLYLISTSFRKSMKLFSFVNVTILSAVNR